MSYSICIAQSWTLIIIVCIVRGSASIPGHSHIFSVIHRKNSIENMGVVSVEARLLKGSTRET